VTTIRGPPNAGPTFPSRVYDFLGYNEALILCYYPVPFFPAVTGKDLPCAHSMPKLGWTGRWPPYPCRLLRQVFRYLRFECSTSSPFRVCLPGVSPLSGFRWARKTRFFRPVGAIFHKPFKRARSYERIENPAASVSVVQHLFPALIALESGFDPPMEIDAVLHPHDTHFFSFRFSSLQEIIKKTIFSLDPFF